MHTNLQYCNRYMKNMLIKTFTFNPFYENTYVISSEDGSAFIIDPGCYEPYEEEELQSYVANNNLNVELIFNTHCHIDHVLGNQFAQKSFRAPLWIPSGEEGLLDAVRDYSKMWGIQGYKPAVPDKIFEEETLTVGPMTFRAIKAPGHSPGHVVLYHEDEEVLLGGDVLFRDSIGRTDLPGGNHAQLLTSIRENLFVLPEDVTVYPGHGPTTTIGYEKVNNPFLK